MKQLKSFLFRLRALFRRDRHEAEMREEIAHHLDLAAAQRTADGATPADARDAANRSFGNSGLIQEHIRDDRGFAWLEDTLRDLRFALRTLARNAGFTTVVVLTLALGIGANTALFSVINSVMLRPLPFPDSGRLVWMAERWRDVEKGSIAYPNFLDWREQQTVFERMGAYRVRSYNLTGDADPIQTTVGEISLDVLATLGIPAALGRLFTPAEDAPGGAPVALLSDGLWRTRYAAAADIVGQTILLNGQAHTVVGVMPASFEFPRKATVWIPLTPVATAANLTNRAAHSGHYAIGRLKPGVTLEQARLNLDAIAARLDEQYPDANRGHRVMLTSVHASIVDGAGRTLWPLFGAAGLVLLIACANIANLLLARASARQKDIALRAALGATRGQILRQLLIESLLLGGVGGLAGLLLAKAALRGLVSVMAASLPAVTDTRLDGTVLVFCATAALVSALLFGLVPAWHASRATLQQALQSSTRGASGRRGRLRLGLIFMEFALTLVLLIGAGLLLRTMVRLQNVDPGYATEHVLTFRVNLNASRYSDPAKRQVFFESLLERLRALPGVQAASMTSNLPLGGDMSNNEFVVEGRPEPAMGARPFADLQVIDRDYFQTMGIPVRRGQTFTADSNFAAIVVDEEFARRHWPGQDPIGQGVRFAAGPRNANPVLTVVGVVGRVKLEKLSDQGGNVQAYVRGARNGMTIVMRTRIDPSALVGSAREQVLALDPNQPIHSVRTLDDLRELSGSPQRLNLTLLGTFALLALGMAAVGLYGVLSYLVAQRQREIGVRIALGARRADVVNMILREGLTYMAAGAVVGLLAAFALGQVLNHLLFEVSPHDPLTFGAVLGVMTVVALFACWLPARRAAKVDPMVALRTE